MRPLSEDETKVFFEKLSTYIGRNIKHLIDRPDEEYCFRLHKERVYYLSQALVRRAAHAERGKLVHLGTCFGKFTKSLKFRLHVTCLDYLAQFAKYKVWVKPSSELSYLYGNNVLKAGLGRITENTPQYQVRRPAWRRRAPCCRRATPASRSMDSVCMRAGAPVTAAWCAGGGGVLDGGRTVGVWRDCKVCDNSNAHTHARTHARMYACTHVGMHVCTYTNTNTHTHTQNPGRRRTVEKCQRQTWLSSTRFCD